MSIVQCALAIVASAVIVFIDEITIVLGQGAALAEITTSIS
jgi:hypothetical protein